jgi:hypothetical protein
MQALHWRRLPQAVGVTASVVVALMLVVPALADWNVGDPYKMHYPQLPDPYGWDVNFTSPQRLADDWLCTESGPVEDVHLWFSSRADYSFMITNVLLRIHADVPAGGTLTYSRPGTMLWQRSFTAAQLVVTNWGSGSQGWYDPSYGQSIPADHTGIWQLNITGITNAFVQQQGVIYWLDVSVTTLGGPLGWKTSISPHFGDDAVWWNQSGGTNWNPLVNPTTYESLDMAFVITPEPNSMVLVALGIGGLWLGCRSRKR